MIFFRLIEVFIIFLFLYLIVNLLRYIFFRESKGGGLFGLSDWWINADRKKEKKR